eukprot:scaffold19825_cov103-Isochrysis_galbana.AAC.3
MYACGEHPAEPGEIQGSVRVGGAQLAQGVCWHALALCRGGGDGTWWWKSWWNFMVAASMLGSSASCGYQRRVMHTDDLYPRLADGGSGGQAGSGAGGGGQRAHCGLAGRWGHARMHTAAAGA